MCSTREPKFFAPPMTMGEEGKDSPLLIPSGLPQLFDAGQPGNFRAALLPLPGAALDEDQGQRLLRRLLRRGPRLTRFGEFF